MTSPIASFSSRSSSPIIFNPQLTLLNISQCNIDPLTLPPLINQLIANNTPTDEINSALYSCTSSISSITDLTDLCRGQFLQSLMQIKRDLNLPRVLDEESDTTKEKDTKPKKKKSRKLNPPNRPSEDHLKALIPKLKDQSIEDAEIENIKYVRPYIHRSSLGRYLDKLIPKLKNEGKEELSNRLAAFKDVKSIFGAVDPSDFTLEENRQIISMRNGTTEVEDAQALLISLKGRLAKTILCKYRIEYVMSRSKLDISDEEKGKLKDFVHDNNMKSRAVALALKQSPKEKKKKSNIATKDKVRANLLANLKEGEELDKSINLDNLRSGNLSIDNARKCIEALKGVVSDNTMRIYKKDYLFNKNALCKSKEDKEELQQFTKDLSSRAKRKNPNKNDPKEEPSTKKRALEIIDDSDFDGIELTDDCDLQALFYTLEKDTTENTNLKDIELTEGDSLKQLLDTAEEETPKNTSSKDTELAEGSELQSLLDITEKETTENSAALDMSQEEFLKFMEEAFD